MCFSATADLVGGVVISAIGVQVLRDVRRREGRDHLMFAALPLLFGLHQITETFVWWGLEGHVSHDVGRVAMYVYLGFAFVVLPTFVPTAIRMLEPPGTRRKVMDGFVALGAAVSLLLLVALVRGPVRASMGGHHVSYEISVPLGAGLVVLYVVATCCSALVSGFKHIAQFGLVNLVAVAVIATLTIDGFASVWCGWAAITSVAIALQVRYGRPHRDHHLHRHHHQRGASTA